MTFGRAFRRRGGAATPFIAAVVGVVSGFYIFNEPLKQQQQQQQQQQQRHRASLEGVKQQERQK